MKGKGMAFALAVLMLMGLAHPAAGQSAVQLKDVQVEQQTDSVHVKLWTTGTLNHWASLIDSPTRLVIALTGTAYAWDKSRMNPDVPPIREIRGSQWKVGTARIVLELTRKVGYRIEPSAEGLSVILEPSGTAVSEDAPKAAASKPAPKAVAKPEAATARHRGQGHRHSHPAARGRQRPAPVHGLQGRGRRQSPPHPRRREREEHRGGRGREGQGVDLAPQRDLGPGARNHPRGQGAPENREGQRDPHCLDRAAHQGARGPCPRQRGPTQDRDRHAC